MQHQVWLANCLAAGTECISARLTVLKPGAVGVILKPWAPQGPVQTTKVLSREEFASPAPSMHDVLRWFERSRSDFLGGPKGLQRVLELGVLVVVSRIDDLDYDCEAAAGNQRGWEVRTSLEVGRSKLTFDERLWALPDVPVACARVTCVCVDAKAGRMIRAPKELLELIEEERPKSHGSLFAWSSQQRWS